MFDFLKRRKIKNWPNLSESQKDKVTARLISTIKNLAGARYKIVSGSDQLQREGGLTETKNEDGILNHSKRGKLLDLARNAQRNNSTFCTILKQFDLQAIGSEGGKAVITFKDGDYSKKVKREFSKYARSCEFFDGLNLNTLLKLILKTEIIGGDMVLLFDDGLVNDSGKILLYEPDEIGNTTQEALERHYGKNAQQSLGRVYTPYSQFQGVIVSRAERGKEVFDPSKCYFLKREPNGNVMDEKWLMPRNIFRIAQGRGITPTTSSLSTIIDLQDYLSFEIAASKKNAQTLAQVVRTAKEEQQQLPSAFDDDTDFSTMSDAEIEQAAQTEIEDNVKTVTLERAQAAGVIYQVMPDDFKLELLQNNHPNLNSIEFVRWLAQSSAAPFGLTSMYATLKVDSNYAGYKGECMMAWPAFEEAQHFLEQICDWVFQRWFDWSVKRGLIEDVDEDFIDTVDWQWPSMKDADPVKEQNAINLKLSNGTGTYKEILGPDWESKLEQVGREIDFCKKNGLPHPSLQTKSGAPIEVEEEPEKENHN